MKFSLLSLPLLLIRSDVLGYRLEATKHAGWLGMAQHGEIAVGRGLVKETAVRGRRRRRRITGKIRFIVLMGTSKKNDDKRYIRHK